MTKKLTKRFISFIVTLAMVTALMPIIPAMAATEVTDVAALAAALAPGTESGYDNTKVNVEGNKVTLLADVNISDTIAIVSGDMTIDLADHNITSTKARVIVVKTGGSLTIDGTTGVISNESASDTDFMVIADGDNTKLTINGGTIEQKKDQVAVQVQNGATMTLTGGTIKGSDTADTNKAAVNVCCDSSKPGGVLTMNGGTISGGCYAVNSFGEGSKVTISGGKLENTASGSGLSVSDKASAEIKGTAEVSGKFGALAKDGAKLTVSGNAKITGTGTNAESGIEVAGNGTTAEIKENAQVSGDYGIFAKNQATLTVSGGTVHGTAAGISTHGDDKTTPADITVSNGTVSGGVAGVYLPSGTMKVKENADISGPAGIVQFGGTLTVEGGTITANGNEDVEIGDSGQTVPPAAVATNKQAGYDDNLKADLKGGTFTAADGEPAVTYTEEGEPAKAETTTFKVEGGKYNSGSKADTTVSQYVDTAKGIDTTTGEIKNANDSSLTLAIIDFGYIDKMNDDGVNAAAKASGKFTSPAGITYTCSDWADATFYWSFNRALKTDETVTITLTAPNGEKYTDTCTAEGYMRFASSFLNNTQLGDDDVTGFQTGKYTIGGQITGGAAVEAIEGAKTATVNDLLPSIAEGAPVVAKATIGDKNGDIKDIVGDYDVKCSAQDSDGNYVIEGTAKALKSHTNGNDAEGYWFGVEIVAPKGVTLGNNYGLTIDEQPKNPEVPVATFQNIPDQLNAKGASIFFNTKGDGQETHKVTINWDDTHEVTYIIDLTGVEHYVEPEPKVALATIADKDGDITKVVTNPNVEYVAESKTIKATATDLKKHTNGADTEGNWFGITIEAPEDLTTKATSGQYTATIDGEAKTPSSFDTLANGKKGAVIYFNVTDNEAPRTLTIKWSDSKEITYNVDLTGVKLYKEPAPTVAAAPIVDKSTTPVTDVVDNGYKAEYDATSKSIKGTATNLKKHENDNNVEAYWFGVEIQAPTDVVVKGNTIDVTIDENSTAQAADYEDLPNAHGKGVIIYFKSTGKADDKHTVTVKWGATSKTLKYDIDLSNVKHFVEAPTVNVGNTTAGTASTDYKATVDATYTDKTTYKYAKVTFTTDTGKQVPYGANGAQTPVEGNWVGITVAPPAGSSITGLATSNENKLPAAGNFKAPDATQGDTAQLSGYYVDASQETIEKPFFFVEITDTLSGVKTVYCYELTKGNPLELEAAPVTKYTVTIDSNIANGAVTADKTADVAADETVTLTVAPEAGYKLDSLSVKDAAGTEVQTAAGTEANTYTFTMPASDVTVTATFVAEEVPVTKYTVTIDSKIANGTVTADKTTAAENETVTLTVTANSGYRFSSVSVKDADGNTVTTTAGTSGKYTFTMPASNVTVTAAFKKTSSHSSGGSSSGGTTTHSVSTPSASSSANGKVSVSSKSAKEGSEVTFTVKPDAGYMTGSVSVKDANGKEIEVKDNGDGTYTFVMPDSKVSIAAEFVKEGEVTPETTPAPEQTPTPGTEENCPSEKFTDVDQSLWYHEGIDYALTNGFMSGISDTAFAPDADTTRAMIVSVLYRLDGSPEVDKAGFTDVPEGAWYADAVAWGEANGVVSGYNEELFGPDDSITREQMASILYRYAQYKGIDVSANTDLSGYSDAASVSDWAVTSLGWANAEELITGMSDTELAPTGTATRAQAASILMRFCENIMK